MTKASPNIKYFAERGFDVSKSSTNSSNSIVESLVKTITQVDWRSKIDYTFDLYIAKIVKTISTFDTDVVLYQ